MTQPQCYTNVINIQFTNIGGNAASILYFEVDGTMYSYSNTDSLYNVDNNRGTQQKHFPQDKFKVAPSVIGTDSVSFTVSSGCTDSEASNHNSAATVDDGSCEYADAVLLSKLCETDPSGYVDQVKTKAGCV